MATQQQIDAGFNAFCAAGDTGLSIYQQIAEVIKAAEQAAWQPIETAPKDGTLIYIYVLNQKIIDFAKWSDTAVVRGCTEYCGTVGTFYNSVTGTAYPDATHWRYIDAPTDHIGAINEKDLK